ncbi:bile acid:sodium symporter family protein [Hellea balneolensis]|uniref:bile acid:sodium symporter family protein n=1 Tax=Hellea balneolensis TaxID=287478 RepID=UPI000420B01B|nr:bile acid:sodium symporter [Hellea balneolensis]
MSPSEIDNFRLSMGGGAESALAIAIAIMMFAVALSLRLEHFRFFKQQPAIYLAGVIGQIIGLPLLTIGLCFILKPIPSVALGMILVACCPGGSVSNILALFGRANTALSVSLTATSSLFAAFLTPVSILFWSSLYPPTNNLLTEINLNIVSFLMQTLIILALPLIAGMLLAKFRPTAAEKLQKPMATLGAALLAGIIIMACWKFTPVYITLGLGLVGIVILHNLLAFLLGNIFARLARADIPSRRAITLEVGIQNSGLGIVILLTQLEGLGGAGAIAGAWGAWHIIGGTALVAFYRWSDRHV